MFANCPIITSEKYLRICHLIIMKTLNFVVRMERESDLKKVHHCYLHCQLRQQVETFSILRFTQMNLNYCCYWLMLRRQAVFHDFGLLMTLKMIEHNYWYFVSLKELFIVLGPLWVIIRQSSTSSVLLVILSRT